MRVKMRIDPFLRTIPIAAAVVLGLGCEGTSPPAETADPAISDIRPGAGPSCEVACQRVVSCTRGGYGDGYGGYGDGYGGYGDGYGGYGSCGGGYAECGRADSPAWCGYGGYGDGYGGYGSLPGYGTYGGGEGYGDCGRADSPAWCGYGGYGDGYGGYGNLPGYGTYGGGYGYGCGGDGGAMFGQCVAGCRALPPGPRHRVIACVMSARSCHARLACE